MMFLDSARDGHLIVYASFPAIGRGGFRATIPSPPPFVGPDVAAVMMLARLGPHARALASARPEFLGRLPEISRALAADLARAVEDGSFVSAWHASFGAGSRAG